MSRSKITPGQVITGLVGLFIIGAFINNASKGKCASLCVGPLCTNVNCDCKK